MSKGFYFQVGFLGLAFGVWDLRFRVQFLVFGVWGLRFSVQGLRFGV
jgi:hypothetical protein